MTHVYFTLGILVILIFPAAAGYVLAAPKNRWSCVLAVMSVFVAIALATYLLFIGWGGNQASLPTMISILAMISFASGGITRWIMLRR